MINEHYTKLENMYLAAPINVFYKPIIQIADKKSEISIKIKEDFFHAANGVHGSVYFKMLDDAAFFAVNSVVDDVFVLTASFKTELLLPINSGELIAKGELLKDLGNKFEAVANLINEKGKIIATGKGIFVKSKMQLSEIDSYKI